MKYLSWTGPAVTLRGANTGSSARMNSLVGDSNQFFAGAGVPRRFWARALAGTWSVYYACVGNKAVWASSVGSEVASVRKFR